MLLPARTSSTLLYFFLLTTLALAEDDSDDSSKNEIAPPPPPTPPINLDANLRRALLKALTELEDDANEKARQSSEETQQHHHKLAKIDITDKIVEKATATALSYFTKVEDSSSTTTTTGKPVVVVQRTKSIQQDPITITSSEPEQILTSATNSLHASYNKIMDHTSRNSLLGLGSSKKESISKITTRSSTAAPPTTTTQESEAKVEDVQFFSAPLVAAFTVHQDERGLPKSVVPIFKTKPRDQVTTTTTTTTSAPQETLRTHQLLQQRQRQLEEEILRLKQQQQQHNYLIRQQQFQHEQQLQLQRQKILEEQVRIRGNSQAFVPIVNLNNSSRLRGSVVSFQPSISFTKPPEVQEPLPLNAQILPIKNAVNFRPFNNNNYVIQQQLPLNNPSNFNYQPLTAPPHNRVFRQEVGTGNFFNNNFNSFDSQPNRVFSRSNQPQDFGGFNGNFVSSNRLQPPVNQQQQLNNLLYNSGFIRSGKQQEDLNIVSKVLSLNHGDFRFGNFK